MGTIRWQHQNVIADSNGLVGGTSPYETSWGEILQFGGWAETTSVSSGTSESVHGEGATNNIPLVGTVPEFNGEGEFVQGQLLFGATPGAAVRVHSWSFTTS